MPGADPAVRTLAARLIAGEGEEIPGDIDHAVVVIHDQETARSHHGAHFGQGLVVYGRITQPRRNASTRRAAHLHRLGVVRTAGLLLFAVFALKAALAPLHLWLPGAYGHTSAPVAAMFAIMTKVGAYAILRVYSLLFGPDSGPAAGLLDPWLLPLALLTVAAGTLGVLASRRLAQQAARPAEVLPLKQERVAQCQQIAPGEAVERREGGHAAVPGDRGGHVAGVVAGLVAAEGEVEILQPAGGETFADGMTIVWQATDADAAEEESAA